MERTKAESTPKLKKNPILTQEESILLQMTENIIGRESLCQSIISVNKKFSIQVKLMDKKSKNNFEEL